MADPVSISHHLFIIRIIIGLVDTVPIFMDRNPVQKFAAVLQKLQIPVNVCERGRGKLRIRIHMPDHFSGLLHQSAPFFGTLGADFPETVIFIPDAPVFDAIRFSMPVGDPLSGIPALCLQIAVLHPVTHFLCSPGSGICTDIGPAAFRHSFTYSSVPKVPGSSTRHALSKNGCLTGPTASFQW